MDCIITEDLYQRSEKVFLSSGLRFAMVRPRDEEALISKQLETGAKCFILGAHAYNEKFYNNVAKHSLVVRYGVGYQAVPLNICKTRSVGVAYTPGTLDASVAEQTFALLLACARKIPSADQKLRGGTWGGEQGLELAGKKIAIIGFGKIGQRVAAIARYGFGMKVKAFGRRSTLGLEEQKLCDDYSTNLAEALKGADFVSLHASAEKDQAPLVNTETLKFFQSGSILLNTSRGALVDEDALFDALASKNLAAAGLDVFVKEPYVPSGKSDLRSLSNVVLTPHTGSNTDAANQRMAESCVSSLKEFLNQRFEKVLWVPEMKDLCSSVSYYKN